MTYINEIWKDIPNYEGSYEVSNYGRVRSSKGKITQSVRHGKRVWKQRILQQKTCKNNNRRVNLWLNKQNKTWLVHRLVAIAFLPKIEGKDFVNHIDGNRLNNKLDNLEWCTVKENNNHAHSVGLMPTNQFIILEDLTNGKLHKFSSSSKACEFIGRNQNYIKKCLDKDIHFVDHFAIYTTKLENIKRVEFL